MKIALGDSEYYFRTKVNKCKGSPLISLTRSRKIDRVSHSEFSRIRNAELERLTLDRMITILGKFEEDVEVTPHLPKSPCFARRITYLMGYNFDGQGIAKDKFFNRQVFGGDSQPII